MNSPNVKKWLDNGGTIDVGEVDGTKVWKYTTSTGESATYYDDNIEKHYLENITLESLAQQAQVSKYYLAHTFEQYYKISPMQYVQSLRLNEAKTLLRTTNIPTRRIASIVGYSTHGYFNQRFVKFEGMTPTEYRNMMQEGFQKDEHAAPLPEESIGTDNE